MFALLSTQLLPPFLGVVLSPQDALAGKDTMRPGRSLAPDAITYLWNLLRACGGYIRDTNMHLASSMEAQSSRRPLASFSMTQMTL